MLWGSICPKKVKMTSKPKPTVPGSSFLGEEFVRFLQWRRHGKEAGALARGDLGALRSRACGIQQEKEKNRHAFSSNIDVFV